MESEEDDADPLSALMEVLPQLLLILFLTLINAFFAMSELAVISVNKTKIDILIKKGNKKALLVQKLNENQTNFLSTIQVGITIAGFFSSATAAGSLSELLSDWLESLNISTNIAGPASVVIITLILSFFTLIFGELFPKKIALAFPEKIAMLVAKPINFIRVLTIPVVKLLSGTCNLLAIIVGLKRFLKEEKLSEEEIKSVVKTGVEDGVLDKEKQKMIGSVLKFNDLTASDIMTPRIKVFMIDIDDNIKHIIKQVFDKRYTRIPVYKDNKDNIIGVVSSKDLMQNVIEKGIENVKIEKIMKKPLFIHELLKINKLFQLMNENQNHLAILLDEFGGVSGITTMEDIVEEVVGDIYDEDDEESNFIKIDEFSYIVNGDTPIQDINRELELELDEENYNYDTIGGYILYTLENIPKEDEKVKFYKGTLIVKEVKNQQIEKIKIIIEHKNENETE